MFGKFKLRSKLSVSENRKIASRTSKLDSRSKSRLGYDQVRLSRVQGIGRARCNNAGKLKSASEYGPGSPYPLANILDPRILGRAKRNLVPRAMPVRGLGWHWLWGNSQPEPLNLGVPVLCRHARLINVKPITAQEKFNFPRPNAILARAQELLWVRDWAKRGLFSG